MKNKNGFNIIDSNGVKIASCSTMYRAKKAVILLCGKDNYLDLKIIVNDGVNK